MANRAQLYMYKGNCCSSCGLSVSEMVERHGTFNRMFQLHHVNPDTKHKSYKKLIDQSISTEQIDEIDKCVLLCTRCHATLHAQEIKGKLKLTAKLKDRTATQEFDGWVKADLLDKTFTFITNQRYLLTPCEIRLGDAPPFELFTIEIEHECNLIDWLSKISTYKSVEVLSIPDRKTLMRIEATEHKNAIKIRQDIEFPVTQINFSTTGNHNDDLWFRNGFVLKKNGEVLTKGVVSYTCNLIQANHSV